MRVSHVITRLIVGGAQENTVATVLGLQGKAPFETDLISGPTAGVEGSLERCFQDAPELLKICPSLVRPVRPVQDFSALFQLRRIFRAERPVVVHTHSGKAGIVGRWAAALEKTPIIIHTIHGPSFGPWQGFVPNLLFRSVEKQAARVTTHFVAVANAMIEQYLGAGIGRPENYTRIFSGFPLEPFLEAKKDAATRARYGISPDDLVIGKIARLFELKGHDDLFAIAPEFVRKFPKARFLIVGGGPWEQRFKNMARDLGVERNFVFTGLVPPGAIPELAGIMDVVAHLSAREGLPRALSQALAAGKPVIAYDADGAREVCLEGKTGFLIKQGNREQLLQRMGKLASDAGLRAAFGAAGQHLVRESFSVEGMVRSIYDLYEKLLRQAGLWPERA